MTTLLPLTILSYSTITVAQANSLSGLTSGTAYLQAQIDSNDPAVLKDLTPNSTPDVDNILFITVGAGGITTATATQLDSINAATTQKINIASNVVTVTGSAAGLKTTFDNNSQFTGLTGAVAVVNNTTESASAINDLVSSNPDKIDISAVTTLTGTLTQVNTYKNAINNAKFSGAASNGSSGAKGTNVTTVRLDTVSTVDASDLHTAKDNFRTDVKNTAVFDLQNVTTLVDGYSALKDVIDDTLHFTNLDDRAFTANDGGGISIANANTLNAFTSGKVTATYKMQMQMLQL